MDVLMVATATDGSAMAPLNKWIDSLSADGRVSDAARVSLEARLAAVAYWLPLAARPFGDDPEKVHQLRVSTRRAIAAFRLYERWLPPQTARWFARRLNRIRRAAGEARDLDVLAIWLKQVAGESDGPVVAIVAKERAAAQPAIESIAVKCEHKNGFHAKMHRLLAKIRPRGRRAKKQDVSFRNWAELQLRRAAERFSAAMPSQNADLSALHQFRIRGKQLRYTLELVATAFGPELRKRHYPVVEELQELLGKINDCVATDGRLRRWRRKFDTRSDQEKIDQLIARRRSELDDAIRAYRSWWIAERAETLQEALMTLAAFDKTQVESSQAEAASDGALGSSPENG